MTTQWNHHQFYASFMCTTPNITFYYHQNNIVLCIAYVRSKAMKSIWLLSKYSFSFLFKSFFFLFFFLRICILFYFQAFYIHSHNPTWRGVVVVLKLNELLHNQLLLNYIVSISLPDQKRVWYLCIFGNTWIY